MSRTQILVRSVIGAVVAVIAVALPFNNPAEYNTIFAQVMYLAIAAMGLNLLTGFNGQISIGHGAFFGVGAFTSAILVTKYGWYVEATLPVAALLAAALGVAIGIPALRVKGVYLGLITLGLAVLFPSVAGKLVKSDFIHAPGGSALLRVKRDNVESLVSGWAPDQYQYFVCLVVMVVLFVAASNLMRSRAGRAMIAVRDHEVAASTVGINVARVKVGTFALSAAYAGVAGGLSVLVDRVADASNPLVYFQRSIEFLVAVVIGGTATILGPLVGAALLVAIRRRFQGTEAMAPALLGIALIAVVRVLPDGVVGTVQRLLTRWIGSSSSASPPPPDDPVRAAVPLSPNQPSPSTPTP